MNTTRDGLMRSLKDGQPKKLTNRVDRIRRKARQVDVEALDGRK